MTHAVASTTLADDALAGSTPGARADRGGNHRRHRSPAVRARKLAPAIARHAILIVASLIFFGPFVWMLLTSVKSSSEALSFPPTFLPREWHFENYSDLFEVAPFGMYYFNSAVVTVFTTLGQVLTSLAAGYAFARLRFRGSNIIFVVLLAALLVPFEVVFTPLISLLSSLGWLNSYQGLIVPNVPSILGVFLFRQFFSSFPTEIEDASRMDGAGVWRRFRSIMAPMATPMIGSFAILSFVYNWNNFFFQFLAVNRTEFFTVPIGLAQLQSSQAATSFNLLMAGSFAILSFVYNWNNFFFQFLAVNRTEFFTVPIGLAQLQSSQAATSFNLLMAGSTLAILPVFLVFLLFQRQIVTAMSGGLR